jgi:hypothetical protein
LFKGRLHARDSLASAINDISVGRRPPVSGTPYTEPWVQIFPLRENDGGIWLDVGDPLYIAHKITKQTSANAHSPIRKSTL